MLSTPYSATSRVNSIFSRAWLLSIEPSNIAIPESNVGFCSINRLIEQNPTLLSGMAILEGSIDNNQALENIELTLEVAEYGVLNNQESSFHGTVLYSDSIVSTVDPDLP